MKYIDGIGLWQDFKFGINLKLKFEEKTQIILNIRKKRQ